MIIKLGGVRSDNYDFTLEKRGSTLIVNGEPFDFSRMQEGDELPFEAFLSEQNRSLFAGSVTVTEGQLVIPMILPYGPYASEAQKFPEPIKMVEDGIVPLPEPDPEPDLGSPLEPAPEEEVIDEQ